MARVLPNGFVREYVDQLGNAVLYSVPFATCLFIAAFAFWFERKNKTDNNADYGSYDPERGRIKTNGCRSHERAFSLIKPPHPSERLRMQAPMVRWPFVCVRHTIYTNAFGIKSRSNHSPNKPLNMPIL